LEITSDHIKVASEVVSTNEAGPQTGKAR